MKLHAGVSRGGFTLVEIMVAVILLALGVLGLAATVGVVARSMNVSFLETQLRARARTEIERLLAGGWERLTSGELSSGDIEVRWQVNGERVGELLLVAHQRLGRYEASDTLVTLVLHR